jgi:hypothetical protein
VAYHIELRQFPHNLCRFNLTEQELRATIVDLWAREQWIELGERKWSPHQATLTVLEGPPLPIERLSMGRGWRTAQRQGQDVTTRVLAAAKEAMDVEPPAPIAPAADAQPPTDEALLADSLGLELLIVLGAGPAPLHRAWELAHTRHPERTASQCLVLAERAVASLLQSRLIMLIWAEQTESAQRQVDDSEVQAVLRAVDSWTREIVGLARR